MILRWYDAQRCTIFQALRSAGLLILSLFCKSARPWPPVTLSTFVMTMLSGVLMAPRLGPSVALAALIVAVAVGKGLVVVAGRPSAGAVTDRQFSRRGGCSNGKKRRDQGDDGGFKPHIGIDTVRYRLWSFIGR